MRATLVGAEVATGVNFVSVSSTVDRYVIADNRCPVMPTGDTLVTPLTNVFWVSPL